MKDLKQKAFCFSAPIMTPHRIAESVNKWLEDNPEYDIASYKMDVNDTAIVVFGTAIPRPMAYIPFNMDGDNSPMPVMPAQPIEVFPSPGGKNLEIRYDVKRNVAEQFGGGIH